MRMIFCFSLLALSLLAISPIGTALADDNVTPEQEIPQIQPKIELAPTYPRVEDIAGGTFQFQIQFLFAAELGGTARDFTLTPKAPPGWDVYMTPQYEKDRKISAIRLEPSYAAGNTILLFANAPFWPLPDPGQYKISLTATSGNITDTKELTAVITAKYALNVLPSNSLYNTTAQADKDNFFSINLQSLSTAPISNITFTTTKPEGWTVKFTPDKIEKLEPLSEQTVDVNIMPPPKTIAGDYSVSIRGTGAQVTASDLNIRVTVETPTIWGWVGVIIILLVIAGLVVVFMRFSRR